MHSPTNEYLYSVCGTGDAMFAAGSNGTVLYYNGFTWSKINSGTTEPLMDVWCLGGSTAYVVGFRGTVLECTAQGGCTPQETDGSTDDLFAVYHSELGAFAAGRAGVVLEKDNNVWKQIKPVPALNDISDLWGDAIAGRVVAVGDEYIYSYDVSANNWIEEYASPYTSQQLTAVTGTEFSDFYVVGYGSDNPYPYNDGIVLHREGGAMVEIKSFADHNLTSACLASGELFVGTASSDVNADWSNSIFRYNGSQWTGMAEKRGANSIGGTGPDDLFVVGNTGLIMHYNGVSWSSMDSGIKDSLDALYVAENGQWALAGSYDKLFRYDGSSWSEVTIPSGDSFYDFWGSGDKIFVVGDGTILTSINSGMSWQAESIPDTTSYLSSIWGAGYNGPFFAAGTDATLLTSQGGWNLDKYGEQCPELSSFSQ